MCIFRCQHNFTYIRVKNPYRLMVGYIPLHLQLAYSHMSSGPNPTGSVSPGDRQSPIPGLHHSCYGVHHPCTKLTSYGS